MPVAPTFETVDPRMPSCPKHSLPAGSCDTHTHVFGPYDSFPFEQPPSYPPPLAPFALHRQMLATIGAQRAVLVQPAPYGANNGALADALRQSGGWLKGIAVATAAVSDAELASLNEAGVRGLRFNEVIDSGTGKRFLGSVGVDELRKLAPRMRELGWHAQIWAKCHDIPSIVRGLADLHVPLVFEHMTSFNAQEGVAGHAFTEVLAMLQDGALWVKLALCRNSKALPDYADIRPFHDALIKANPASLLWASDWPFVRLGALSPDVGRLIDLFFEWLGDDPIARRILVENPAQLYGFPPAA